MSHHHVDQAAVTLRVVVGEDQGGEAIDITGWSLPVIIPEDEVAALLAAYDPNDPATPDVDTCRDIARSILESLRVATGG